MVISVRSWHRAYHVETRARKPIVHDLHELVYDCVQLLYLYLHAYRTQRYALPVRLDTTLLMGMILLVGANLVGLGLYEKLSVYFMEHSKSMIQV